MLSDSYTERQENIILCSQLLYLQYANNLMKKFNMLSL